MRVVGLMIVVYLHLRNNHLPKMNNFPVKIPSVSNVPQKKMEYSAHDMSGRGAFSQPDDCPN
jgi:hypothetical protein